MRKALVKDVEADRLDRERAVRNMSTPWRYELNTSLQITQNYATNNWYQGASNSFSMLASAKGYIRYKGENVLWENNGEWRAGFSTVSGDSLRKVNTTDDVFRINSKLGYQVHEHWYVSAIGEFRTNLWNNWRANTKELSTGFFTPIRFTLGRIAFFNIFFTFSKCTPSSLLKCSRAFLQELLKYKRIFYNKLLKYNRIF